MEEAIRTGSGMLDLAGRLFPIYRSITGDGVRETLKIIDDYIGGGLSVTEIPSGTPVLDWQVPKEWRIKSAYIESETGERIIDFHDNNLCVVGYSSPVNLWMSLDELKEHIYTIVDQPEVIPYVTSYYDENWGFCMSDKNKNSLKPGRYHAVIESELFDGSMTYGDILVNGETNREILISTYVCHPSLANDNCSGPALAAELIRYVKNKKNRKYTYRFVFGPETIGAITYISKHINDLKTNVNAAFILSCVGDNGSFSLVESRYGNSIADRVMKNILRHRDRSIIYSYLERGSDERQYGSPLVDLPVVGFCRTKYHVYPEYHTSADGMDILSSAGFQGAYDVMVEAVEAIENNEIYKTCVICEPQLGKRGIMRSISKKGDYGDVKVVTNFLAYADGTNDLVEISDRIGVPIRELVPVVNTLSRMKLIEVI